MHRSKQLKKVNDLMDENNEKDSWLTILMLSVLSFASAFLLFLRKPVAKKASRPDPKIDIEIRYDTEKDADAAFLAQNTVKIIKMVLTPIENQIKEENAQLIFVYGDDAWEMRLRNASDPLKTRVRSLLEAQEW